MTARPGAGTPALTVGIDTVSVADVRASVAGFGARYLDRVYTAAEQAACAGSADAQARSLAGRFAAKEATVKALHAADLTGPWTDVEVLRSPGGWPLIQLYGGAARAARSAGVADLSVSITHDRDLASAVVVAVHAPQASHAIHLNHGSHALPEQEPRPCPTP